MTPQKITKEEQETALTGMYCIHKSIFFQIIDLFSLIIIKNYIFAALQTFLDTASLKNNNIYIFLFSISLTGVKYKVLK